MTEREQLRQARAAYARGENVMELFRTAAGTDRNSVDAVLVSYDLQSGSYRAALDDADVRARAARYVGDIVRELDALDFTSMLDAGTGEATTLMPVLAGLASPPERVAAFDLAWSRVAHARAHARTFPVPAPELFTANLFEIPAADGAFDLVFTSHALEPNHGREREGLAELARVSRKWVALFEPGYELGDDAARRHMETHGYVRCLRDVAEELGLTVVRHARLPHSLSPLNPTAVLVLRTSAPDPAPADWRVCPRCHGPLTTVNGHLFCTGEGLVFPVLDGIPCLSERTAVVASAFDDVRLGAAVDR